MQLLKCALVRLLLLKSFIKALVRQLYIKLTKFTRRSRDAQGYHYKLVAGYDFVKHMLQYNWEVIRRSRRCLDRLFAENVRQVFVYGERDVKEVLYDLTFEIPVEVRAINDHYETNRKAVRDSVPIKASVTSRDKIIVASLVNTEDIIRRLRELGVDNERIVLLP